MGLLSIFILCIRPAFLSRDTVVYLVLWSPDYLASEFASLFQFGFATPFSLQFSNLNNYTTAIVIIILSYNLTFIFKLDVRENHCCLTNERCL